MGSTRHAPLVVVLAALAVLLVACGGDGGESSAAGSGPGSGATGNPPGSGPTFHRDVEPILQQSCQNCHRPGGIAPFSLIKYSDAASAGKLIVDQTQARTMPPFGALDTDECKPEHPWKDDLRLSEDAIATLAAWQAAGAPEGDPADAPPPIDPPAAGLENPDRELLPKAPFVTSGNADQFRCFVLDPKLTQQTFINATDVLPGNPKVVHHVLVYSDPGGASLAMADEDGGFDCFGGSGIPSSRLITGWVPGMNSRVFPKNVGMELDAGSLLVMQIHYHPGGMVADPDQTTLQLKFNDAPPEYHAISDLKGNYGSLDANGDGLQAGPDDPPGGPAFVIPAGAKGHTETMVTTVPAGSGGEPLPELRILSIASHMHLVGVDEKITHLHQDTGKTECLLQTPKWSFSWQRLYQYDDPIESLPIARTGDRTTIRCTYDNTADNPAVAKALAEQKLPGPIDVSLGEATLDEMCLLAVTVVYKAP